MNYNLLYSYSDRSLTILHPFILTSV